MFDMFILGACTALFPVFLILGITSVHRDRKRRMRELYIVPIPRAIVRRDHEVFRRRIVWPTQERIEQ
jgi:hypothetical protein